ncbi:unnamed protein product [Sphagnum jensenii]|uniref:RING-type E3 ubiquitin transferase n=1 Tax=Sphagnum jensenii TaxID=128206 RepID=A0ABP0XE90_9BRYO
MSSSPSSSSSSATTTQPDTAAVRTVMGVMGSWAMSILLNNELRQDIKSKCLERLQLKTPGFNFQYAEKAVIANLDWGIEGLESALKTTNQEARAARLEDSEKMLQVPALLDPKSSTTGIPNTYLSAWAHLYLALVWKLRNNDFYVATHLLEMLLIDPTYARLDFAPDLWEQLFHPHLANIEIWFQQEYENILKVACTTKVPNLLKRGVHNNNHHHQKNNSHGDLHQEQVVRLELLNKLYMNCLDMNTQQYAQYYKDWMAYAAGGMRSGDEPSLPKTQTPPTPKQHETPPPPKVAAKSIDDSETPAFSVTASTPHSPSAEEKREARSKDQMSTNTADSVQVTQSQDQQASIVHQPFSSNRDCETKLRSLGDNNGSPNGHGEVMEAAEQSDVLTLPRDQPIAKELDIGGCSLEAVNPSPSSSLAPSSDRNHASAAKESTGFDKVAQNRSSKLLGIAQHGSGKHVLQSCSLHPSAHSPSPLSTSSLEDMDSSQVKPPKDFVCFITKQLFEDPVTLETGQTFERHAIQQWLDHGNTTCPITHQRLSSLMLPQTNFVLKRLVDAWRDEHLELGYQLSRSSDPLCNTSPTVIPSLHIMNHHQEAPFYNNETTGSSPRPKHRLSCRFSQRGNTLSQAGNSMTVEDLEGLMRVLKPALASLCTAEELTECEAAVRQIVHIWIEKKGSPAIVASLSKVAVIDGLMEVLSNSVNEEILRATVSLLSVLVFKDELARHAVVRADPSYETIVNVLQMEGVPQAAVLLYLLKPGSGHLAAMEIIPSVVKVLQESETIGMGAFQLSWSPKAAAVLLLEQLVTSFDFATNMSHAESVVHMGSAPFLISQLESKVFEERLGAAKVLCCCMQADGGCRYTVAYSANLSPLVEMLHNCKGQSRTVATSFLIELTHLNRREAIEKIMRPVQSEGILSSMCVLLVDLQIAPLEQRPLTAALLLQLDLLFESRRHSMYREEALEALVMALTADENPKAQLEAAKVFATLGGRFSYSGKSLDKAWLLKTAGMAESYHRAMKDDQGPWSEDMVLNPDEGERVAAEWDLRVSHAILGSNGRQVLEAIGLALHSQDAQVAKFSLVAATWFATQLAELPDTGLQAVARNCFLQPMVLLVQQNGKEMEEKVLASLALNSFLSDAVGVQQMGEYSKDLIGPLQYLKSMTWTAKTMLNTLVNSPSMHSNSDIWAHGEVHLMDASLSGETRALLFAKGFLYSAHMDGSIKVWDTRRREPRLLKEVKAHLKPALCLAYLQSANQLYTGSADKTIRVWALEDEGMKCLRMVDVKEPVVSLVVNSRFTAILPQGAGIKLLDETGSSKLLNGNKHVQSMLIIDDIIYCGCTDNSIQEIDTTTGAVVSIQTGMRLLRGKKPIYAMQVYQDLLFTAGAFVEGGGTKVWQRLTRVLVTSVPTQSDVRAMAVSDDFLYLASNLPGGTIEVWLRARLTKVATLNVGSKVTALSLVGETLYSGSEDGKIRAFALNS